VRAGNIFRKAGADPEAILREGVDLDGIITGSENDDIWSLWLTAAKLGLIIDQSIATSEPAYLAKYAFQLAQAFNNFYHRHHILTEADEGRKRALLATAAIARRELIRALAVMGITAPSVM
jgi:arginyl-tRNA synthetase